VTNFNLCFIHVEKAAGTTFSDLMLRCLPRYWVMRPQPGKYGFRYDARSLRKLRSILRFEHLGGHALAAYENYESVLANPLYVSFLRDPIKRYLSHANWIAGSGTGSAKLSDFLSKPRMRNIQCFRICGKREFAPARELIEQKDYFLGISEHFDESVFMLQLLLGLDLIRIERSNVTIDENRRFALPQLDNSARQQLVAANREDLKLYDWVVGEWYPAQKQRIGYTDEDFQQYANATAIKKLDREFYVKKKIKNAVSIWATKVVLAESQMYRFMKLRKLVKPT
jgi:hypothetical protein